MLTSDLFAWRKIFLVTQMHLTFPGRNTIYLLKDQKKINTSYLCACLPKHNLRFYKGRGRDELLCGMTQALQGTPTAALWWIFKISSQICSGHWIFKVIFWWNLFPCHRHGRTEIFNKWFKILHWTTDIWEKCSMCKDLLPNFSTLRKIFMKLAFFL